MYPSSRQDKKYATDKYKDIYTELSIVKAKAERDLGRLREQLQLAHEALGEPSLEEVERAGGYGSNIKHFLAFYYSISVFQMEPFSLLSVPNGTLDPT